MNSEKLFMRINAKKSFENYSQFSYLCQVRFSLNPFSNMQIKTSIFCKNLLLEYNHQGMTSQILDGTKKMDFTYDYSGSRNTMKYYEGSTLKRSKIYCGMYEKETDSYGTKEICYVSTPAGTTAFHLKTNGGSAIFYQHLDHQGSPLVLSDQGGNKIYEQSFDAWGRRRKPTDYSYNNISLSSIPLRGYTGHEMIDEFNLINMNGRIYDPQLCRFLAPDRFVQAPGNSQSFNRYSYCLNNPLKYVDPSGYSWLSKGWNEFKQMNTHDKIASFIVITGLGGPFTWGTRWSYLSNRLSGDGMSHKEAINNTMIQTWFYGTVGGSDESELPADPYNPDNLGTPSNYNYLSEVYTPEFYRYSELMACNDCGGVTDIGQWDYKDVTNAFDAQLLKTKLYFSKARDWFDINYPEGGLDQEAYKLMFFRSKVNDNAVFDIKRTEFSRANLGADYGIYRGQEFRYDDFGNYNYGVAAKYFGFTLERALLGAGGNQISKLNPDFGNPGGYLDHGQDSEMISKGYYHKW